MSLGTHPLGTTTLGAAFIPFVGFKACAVGESRMLLTFYDEVKQLDPLDDTDALNPDNYLLTDEAGQIYSIAWLQSVSPSEVELILEQSLPDEIACIVTILTDFDRLIMPRTATFTSLAKLKSRTRESRDGQDFLVPMSEKDRPQGATSSLGVFGIDGTGDYLSGRSLRTRLTMRLLINKGDYAYAPDYGCEIEKYKGRLLGNDLYTSLSSDIKAQMLLEPEVTKVKVGFKPQGKVLVITVTAICENETVTVEQAFDWAA